VLTEVSARPVCGRSPAPADSNIMASSMRIVPL
jgi:hypothetical protein